MDTAETAKQIEAEFIQSSAREAAPATPAQAHPVGQAITGRSNGSTGHGADDGVRNGAGTRNDAASQGVPAARRPAIIAESQPMTTFLEYCRNVSRLREAVEAGFRYATVETLEEALSRVEGRAETHHQEITPGAVLSVAVILVSKKGQLHAFRGRVLTLLGKLALRQPSLKASEPLRQIIQNIAESKGPHASQASSLYDSWKDPTPEPIPAQLGRPHGTIPTPPAEPAPA
jgi:hypothetical protein